MRAEAFLVFSLGAIRGGVGPFGFLGRPRFPFLRRSHRPGTVLQRDRWWFLTPPVPLPTTTRALVCSWGLRARPGRVPVIIRSGQHQQQLGATTNIHGRVPVPAALHTGRRRAVHKDR